MLHNCAINKKYGQMPPCNISKNFKDFFSPSTSLKNLRFLDEGLRASGIQKSLFVFQHHMATALVGALPGTRLTLDNWMNG